MQDQTINEADLPLNSQIQPKPRSLSGLVQGSSQKKLSKQYIRNLSAMQSVYRHKVLNSYEVYSSSDRFLPIKQDNQSSPQRHSFHFNPKSERRKVAPIQTKLETRKWQVEKQRLIAQTKREEQKHKNYKDSYAQHLQQMDGENLSQLINRASFARLSRQRNFRQRARRQLEAIRAIKSQTQLNPPSEELLPKAKSNNVEPARSTPTVKAKLMPVGRNTVELQRPKTCINKSYHDMKPEERRQSSQQRSRQPSTDLCAIKDISMPVLAHRSNQPLVTPSEDYSCMVEKLVRDKTKPVIRPDKFVTPHPLVSGLTSKHLPLSYCHSPGPQSHKNLIEVYVGVLKQRMNQKRLLNSNYQKTKRI